MLCIEGSFTVSHSLHAIDVRGKVRRQRANIFRATALSTRCAKQSNITFYEAGASLSRWYTICILLSSFVDNTCANKPRRGNVEQQIIFACAQRLCALNTIMGSIERNDFLLYIKAVQVCGGAFYMKTLFLSSALGSTDL